METILMITSWISEFMKHAVSTFATLAIQSVKDAPGFALFFLGCFVLITIALMRQSK